MYIKKSDAEASDFDLLMASDELNMVLFQFAIDAEAGDAHRCAAAIRIIGGFTCHLVVNKALVSVFRFRPLLHVFRTQIVFWQPAESVVIELDVIACAGIKVEQGVECAVKWAVEEGGICIRAVA